VRLLWGFTSDPAHWLETEKESKKKQEIRVESKHFQRQEESWPALCV
jgi:hypothetical protein